MTTLQDREQWKPFDGELRNAPGSRSPEQLRAVLAQFDVVRSPRYRAADGKTYCNIFVWDATRALGCEIPHWLDNPRRELSANGVCDWLASELGAAAGWRLVTSYIAFNRATEGFPVVASWKNETGGSGHVAMLLPPENGEFRIAQAGKRNFFDGRLATGFGDKPVLFYTHD